MSGSGKFKNKQILIVGATGGLGGSIARHLKCEAASLILSGRNEVKLNALSQELGADSLSVDLSDSAGCAQLADTIGAVDGVVYAAGMAPVAPVRYLKDADVEVCLNVNMTGPLLLVRDLLKIKS